MTSTSILAACSAPEQQLKSVLALSSRSFNRQQRYLLSGDCYACFVALPPGTGASDNTLAMAEAPSQAESSSADGGVDSVENADNPSTTPRSSPLRMRTNTADIDNTITHPGSVKINVKGAFIVDQDSASPNGPNVNASANGGSHDTKDIRLPNHTAVVSHIAVDVCFSSL